MEVKIIILIIVVFAAVLFWSMCIASSASDEEAERLYQDYLEYKRRKEQKNEDRL